MTVLIDGKLEDPLIKDKKVSLLGGVICGQKISMEKKDRCEKGRNQLSGRRHIAGPTTYRRADDVRILQGRQRKVLCGLYGDNALWRNKVCSTDKEAGMGGGKEDIKGDIYLLMGEYLNEKPGKGREVSVGLVRRRETPRRLEDQRRTDIGGISRMVVGRAVGKGCWAGRARRRHTEVRSSYHFRVRTKFRNKERTKEIQDLSQSLDMTNDDSREK
ncbi:hypothetical protein BY996DRAFT_8399715 [Phakopsora pachyrhizi]|nr:hypothetical protein BY996DRAFT_8399715 [Phakopsora pachyrhizi]